MANEDFGKFAKLSFDDFRRMAKDDSMSCYERVGFPDSYRKGKENIIFHDIREKLRLLSQMNKVVLEIGPGCSPLPLRLIELCRGNGHHLLLVDSPEMLEHLPDEEFITKIQGYYPDCDSLFPSYLGKIDVILAYSVLHYVFAESNLWKFIDKSMDLLAHGGEMLIGDVPNVSMRKRFFSAPAGIRFHKEYTGKDEDPDVKFNVLEHGRIDDSIVLSILLRARLAGCDAYVLPQNKDLPMANRREDLLIVRP